jgi:hypothetical protein
MNNLKNKTYNLYNQVGDEEFAELIKKGIISIEEAQALYEQATAEQDLQDSIYDE